MSSSDKHILYLSRYREDKLELREMTPEEQWRLHDRLLEVELLELKREILNNSQEVGTLMLNKLI